MRWKSRKCSRTTPQLLKRGLLFLIRQCFVSEINPSGRSLTVVVIVMVTDQITYEIKYRLDRSGPVCARILKLFFFYSHQSIPEV